MWVVGEVSKDKIIRVGGNTILSPALGAARVCSPPPKFTLDSSALVAPNLIIKNNLCSGKMCSSHDATPRNYNMSSHVHSTRLEN